MSFCYVLVYSFPLCFLNILTICLYRHRCLHVHLVQVVKRNHHGEYWHQTKAIPRLIRQICCRFETELLQLSGPKRKSEVLRSTDTSGDVTPSSTLGALTARHVRIRWPPHTRPVINRQSGDLTGTVSHTHEVQLPSLNWTDNRVAILEVYLMSAVVSENSVLFDQCIIHTQPYISLRCYTAAAPYTSNMVAVAAVLRARRHCHSVLDALDTDQLLHLSTAASRPCQCFYVHISLGMHVWTVFAVGSSQSVVYVLTVLTCQCCCVQVHVFPARKGGGRSLSSVFHIIYFGMVTCDVWFLCSFLALSTYRLGWQKWSM